MNKVVLIGRLTKQPELKFTPGTGTAVATFTLAIDRKPKDGKKEADYVPIVAWGKIGENCANYLDKGKLCGVSGRIQTRSYAAKDGTKRYVTEIVADEVQFLEFDNKQQGGNKDLVNTYDGNFSGQTYDDEMIPVDDGEIPF